MRAAPGAWDFNHRHGSQWRQWIEKGELSPPGPELMFHHWRKILPQSLQVNELIGMGQVGTVEFLHHQSCGKP